MYKMYTFFTDSVHRIMKQFQTEVKMSIGYKIIVYHKITIEICNNQCYIKTCLIA